MRLGEGGALQCIAENETPAVAIAHPYTDTFEVAVSLRQEDIDES
jgi:hypothetical protein